MGVVSASPKASQSDLTPKSSKTPKRSSNITPKTPKAAIPTAFPKAKRRTSMPKIESVEIDLSGCGKQGNLSTESRLSQGTPQGTSGKSGSAVEGSGGSPSVRDYIRQQRAQAKKKKKEDVSVPLDPYLDPYSEYADPNDFCVTYDANGERIFVNKAVRDTKDWPLSSRERLVESHGIDWLQCPTALAKEHSERLAKKREEDMKAEERGVDWRQPYRQHDAERGVDWRGMHGERGRRGSVSRSPPRDDASHDHTTITDTVDNHVRDKSPDAASSHHLIGFESRNRLPHALAGGVFSINEPLIPIVDHDQELAECLYEEEIFDGLNQVASEIIPGLRQEAADMAAIDIAVMSQHRHDNSHDHIHDPRPLIREHSDRNTTEEGTMLSVERARRALEDADMAERSHLTYFLLVFLSLMQVKLERQS